MPKYIKGDMFDDWRNSDMFVCTCNSLIKSNGKLCMGAGIAKRVRDTFKNSDDLAAKLIQQHPNPTMYGFVWHKRIGFLQVKNNPWEEASPVLLNYALTKLRDYARANPTKRIDLNFPAIGHGGLEPAMVKAILDQLLPDNVNVWYLK